MVGIPSLLTLVVTFLLLGSCIYLIVKIILWTLLGPKYTKERFAFTVAKLLSTGFALLIVTLYANQIPMVQLGFSGNSSFGFVMQPANLEFSDRLLILFIYAAFAVSMLWLYHKWPSAIPGATSVAASDTPTRGALKDLLKYLIDREWRKLADQIYRPSLPRQPLPNPQPQNWSPLERAVHILRAYDSQFQTTVGDWSASRKAFFTKFSDQNAVVYYFGDVESFLAYRADENPQFNADVVYFLLCDHLPTDLDEEGLRPVKLIRPPNKTLRNANLNLYRRELLRRLSRRPLRDDGPTILESFVPPVGGTSRGRRDIPSLFDYVLEWINLGPDGCHLALLGEFGLGKSVFALRLALHLLDNLERFERVPIVIELGGLSPRTESLDDLLNRWCRRYDVPFTLARLWVDEGSALVILDAFDEMDFIGDRSARAQHFNRLWEFARPPSARVLITGRPNLFLDQAEIRTALRLLDPGPIQNYTRPVYIARFNQEQIELALQPWPIQIKQNIMSIYRRSKPQSGLRDLLSRPSTLALAASVWPRLIADYTEQELDSAVVLEAFLLSVFERQYQKHRDRNAGARPLLKINELATLMRSVAITMAVSGQTNRVRRTEFAEIIEKTIARLTVPAFYSAALPDEERSERVRDSIDGCEISLPEFIAEDPRRLEQVIVEAVAQGIIEEDPGDLAMLRMGHKSFFEFLCGESLIFTLATANESLARQVETIKAITDVDLIKHMPTAESTIFGGQLASKYGLSIRELERSSASRWIGLAALIYHYEGANINERYNYIGELPPQGIAVRVFVLTRIMMLMWTRGTYNIKAATAAHRVVVTLACSRGEEFERFSSIYGRQGVFATFLSGFDYVRYSPNWALRTSVDRDSPSSLVSTLAGAIPNLLTQGILYYIARSRLREERLVGYVRLSSFENARYRARIGARDALIEEYLGDTISENNAATLDDQQTSWLYSVNISRDVGEVVTDHVIKCGDETHRASTGVIFREESVRDRAVVDL